MEALPSDALLDLALRAAQAAGALLGDRFGGPASGLAAKSSRTDLVSDTDRDSEALIVGMIRAARPDDAIVGEEGASAGGRSGLSWLVDPLDGTINYLWGIPHYAVSIAVADGEGRLLGVVHDPCRAETFAARRGYGAWLDDEPLRLVQGPDLGEALVGVGFSYTASERSRQAVALQHILPRVRDVRRYGAAALDLAWVACGRLDGFWETELAPWDWAAGALLVTEAGGTVRELPRAAGAPPGVLAARPGLDDELERLARTLP